MDKRPKKFKKINPNEFGGLLYDHQELDGVLHVLFESKIFRYATRKASVVDRFEKEVCKYLDIKFALGLNNGTSALRSALHAVGVRPQQRVLISAYTFVATAASVATLNAIPVPIDIDLQTGLDTNSLEKEIKKGCVAIVVVHLQGRAFDISSVLKLASKYSLPVIEDACQAFGTRFRGRHAGCLADVGVYSFQQYKQISAGEGGLLVTNNEQYYNCAKIYSDHGIIRENMSWEGENAVIGDNLRMSNLQAAILRSQLKRLPLLIKLQKSIRERVLSMLPSKAKDYLLPNIDPKGETGMNLIFLAPTGKIALDIISLARTFMIEVRKPWDRPYYLHRVFNSFSPSQLESVACPQAEDLAQRLVAISLPPTLTFQQIKRISKLLSKIYNDYLS